ncbi:MAG TPA: CopG family transcriptional regulator [Coxiellaceae bacterium]|nr:MAG: CopG family transcriptional regulator [Gammaproteobacteria bacterium RIFCSPHIGHO2_12_FULL_36_30]HLB57166.1 CopG family transcriptional regulator [Coxiellaceae bacterium]
MQKRKKIYSDKPVGSLRAIKDFLPRPEDLILKKEETTKITLSLPRESVNFFKELAVEHHTQYQKMIRNLLVLYVAHERKNRLARRKRHG